MDKLTEECLQEVALEGLDGITLECLWMRLETRDPAFSLALDEYSKPVIWQQIARSDDVEFFELPEARKMPILRDALEDGNKHWSGATCVGKATAKKMNETVYPMVFVEDKEKGIRGSCATYNERQDVTEEIRDDEGNVKMSYAEAESRWGAKLVVVANQDMRKKRLAGLYGDMQEELTDKQYMMLEAICRARQLGVWQFVLCKWMKLDARNMFYHQKILIKRGFIKKRMAVYMVEDKPHKRSVILFSTSFKEHVAQPMYETLMEGMSDFLEKRPNRLWTVPALRTALRGHYTDITITDKTFKRVIAAARAAKIVERLKLTHEQVFNEKKLNRDETDLIVNGVKLLRTYEEYVNEENLDDEDDEEKRDPVFFGNPLDSVLVAERNLKANLVDLVEERQMQGVKMPQRAIIHSLMLDYYITRYMLRKLAEENIVTHIMTDEGRQRTAVYMIANSEDRMQQMIAENIPGPSTSSATVGDENKEAAITIKEEVVERPSTPPMIKGSSAKTLNHQRRRQFILDFMRTNKVIEYVFPIIKAIRAEEKKLGMQVTCDAKTVRRIVNLLCEENLLQQIETVVVSDDGMHSKNVTLVTEYGIKPGDLEVTSALQVARFRFFGSLSNLKRKKGEKATPTKPPISVENIGAPPEEVTPEKPAKEIKSPKKKKKKKDDKEKKHGHNKTPKKAKHKHKHKDEDGVETVSSDDEQPKVKPYASRKYYYRQLGYQPKMLRMKVAHHFLWYMAYGHSNPRPVKTEVFKDIEDVDIEDTDKLDLDVEADAEVVGTGSPEDASLPPIPVKIQKAGDYGVEEVLDDSPSSSGRQTPVVDIEDSSQQAIDETRPSAVARNADATSLPDGETHSIPIPDDPILIDETTDTSQGEAGIENMRFKVYSNTYDWRRYVPPLPVDSKRPTGWCVLRDLLLAMPISIFLKIVSLPVEVKGIKEYLDHPMKKHILMRHLPIHIRKQLLRGRSYLFSLQDILIKLSSVGLCVLTNTNNVNKDQLTTYICRKASILDTTTTNPGLRKISDQQRYMRRFYQLDSLKAVEDYWFDMQCICLGTPLGMGKERGRVKKKGKVREDFHYESHIRSIATIVPDITQPIQDDGIPPGDGRGAGGFDTYFFSHMRRNWNWYNAVPEVHFNRYTGMNPTSKEERKQAKQDDKKKKLKRLGSIQYKRSNMSKGMTVEVVSVTRQERKEMQATVTNLKAKKFEGQEKKSPPTKRQLLKSQTKAEKEKMEEAKKKDAKIEDERRKVRTSKTETGKRNTTTYDDKDEEARNQMTKMRVDWTPEEDSLILLCRVASTLLNTKASKIGAFVPWYVIRDILHKNIERSKDKTTKSLAKRSHHIMKNKSTYLNFKICMAEAQTDKELMALVYSQTQDYTKVSVCADVFGQFVTKLQEKFQSNTSTIGALRDIGQLNDDYIITPVHHHPIVDEKILIKRDVKSVEDIHFKLLCSLVMSSLSSCKSELFNNHLLYKTYEQYDQDLLGSVFMYIRKLGFCNRYRKSALISNAKRVIPVAPLTIQLSNSYKERLNTGIPDLVIGEVQEFLDKWNEADDSLVLATEANGGVCAGALSLISSNKVSFDITLPDSIIVVDTNLLHYGNDITEKDLGSDSDSDDDEEPSTKEAKKDQSDIDMLMRIQQENTPEKEKAVTTQDVTKPTQNMTGVESGTSLAVLCDHSYSVVNRTLPEDGAEGSRQTQESEDPVPITQSQRTTSGDDNATEAQRTTSKDDDDVTEKDGAKPDTNDGVKTDTNDGVKTDTNQSKSDGASENKAHPASGYDIPSTQVSHSKWLVLQGNAAPGVCGLGKNVQDNTSVNACTITLLKPKGSNLDTRTSDKSEGRWAMSLMWDFILQDDGMFSGFRRPDRRTLSFDRKEPCILDPKWIDVDSMINGIGLQWKTEDLYVLRTIYTCIEDAGTLGIAAETDFQQQCAALSPATKTISDCLYLLVQQQLVLELGFDILRFVTTRHAYPWLIHSTQLDHSVKIDCPIAYYPQSKKQRMDPLMTDPPVIDITEDDDMVLGNDDEKSRTETNKRPKTEEDESEHKTGVDQTDKEEVETEEEMIVSGKRKRPPSPTECDGTPVTFLGRPWLSIEGYQCDSELHKFLQLTLLSVVTKPGIKEKALIDNLKDILHPVECLELLKMLKDAGCITRHLVYKLKGTSIFKTPMQEDPNEKMYFYQPTANCLTIYAELARPKPTKDKEQS